MLGYLAKRIFTLLITLSLIILVQITETRANVFGSCDSDLIYQPDDIFYYKLQMIPEWGSRKPWIYSADFGGMTKCKKFMNMSEETIMIELPRTGWGMGKLERRAVSKDEFCRAKHFAPYGLGASALEFCDPNSLSNEGRKALVESGEKKKEKTSLFDDNGTGGDPDESNIMLLNNAVLCAKATTSNGNEWINNRYKSEAINRGLNLFECRTFTGRSSESSSSDNSYNDSPSVEKVESNSLENTNSIKEKLKKLKSLLDEGLISQEQYEDKSSEILDQF